MKLKKSHDNPYRKVWLIFSPSLSIFTEIIMKKEYSLITFEKNAVNV